MLNKVLFFLIAVAIIARFAVLDKVPPHLSNDEIGAAYDAYSVSKTLRDVHNQFLPISFLSNGAPRSPLAVYLTIPSIIFLGNNDFSVRLPSAIFGTLTIILLGFLSFELTRNKRLAIVSSLMLAFSPWHMAGSWAMQSNYALFFIVLGIYLFFLGKRHNNAYATLASFAVFAFSIYTYYTEWGLTPLIIASLLFSYRDVLLKKKVFFIGVALFILLLTPLITDFFTHLSSSRASSVFISRDSSAGNSNILKIALDKYSRYISFSYIFFNGSNLLPKDNPYQVGFFLSPFLISFLFGLFKLKEYFKENATFIYLWLLISPIVPALSQGDLNNLRSLPMVLPLSLVIASGTIFIFDHIKKPLKILAMGIILVSVLYFIFIYFFHFPIQSAEGFQYGYKQMALYIKDHYSEYDKIIIDQRFGSKDFYFSGLPSQYIPFYTYLDPRKPQNPIPLHPLGVSFDKYEFRDIHWDKEKIQEKYLYAVPFDEIPSNIQAQKLKPVYEIQLPNHKVEFILYSVEKNP